MSAPRFPLLLAIAASAAITALPLAVHAQPGAAHAERMMGQGPMGGAPMGGMMMGQPAMPMTQHGMMPGGQGMMGGDHGMMGRHGMGHGMDDGGDRAGPMHGGMMRHGMVGGGMGGGASGFLGGEARVRVLPSFELQPRDVERHMTRMLERLGNARLKLGPVAVEGDTILADIVTQDGSLVQRFRVDRATGLGVVEGAGP